MIECREVMLEPKPIDPEISLADALDHIGDRSGAFACDSNGRPTGLLTIGDCVRVASMGSIDMSVALRNDFDTTAPETTLNAVYAAAGRGLPVAVVDNDGRLVGNLDPRHIMEEMGRVEQLIDGFERETYL